MKKNITILGAGESGMGAAMLAREHGYVVFVSDSGSITLERKNLLEQLHIDYEEGKHDEERILSAELIVKSPGIPFSVPLVQKALGMGLPVIDELEFAFRFSKAGFIAITGTNGKTTTSLLTYHLLKSAGVDVALAGNVGHSLAAQLARRDYDWVVLEVSSFQVDGFHEFRPNIGVILNITPDHLDRYEQSTEKYAASKLALTQNMTTEDHLIYFEGSELLTEQLAKTNTQAQKHAISLVSKADIEIAGTNMRFNEEKIALSTEGLPLQGMHNYINTAAAIKSAMLAGVGFEAVQVALKTFKNAAHRMEKVADTNGVAFVNDSKATNVDAVYYALGSYKTPIVWIAGGVDKGNDYSQLDELITNVRALVCLGTDNRKLMAYYQGKIKQIYSTDNLYEAVAKAYEFAKAGDTVLLSPACASFDLFDNYEHRGNEFKESVLKLKENLKNINTSKA